MCDSVVPTCDLLVEPKCNNALKTPLQFFPIHETKCNIFSSKQNQRENQIRTIEIEKKRAKKREFHLQSSAMWSFGQKHQWEEKQIYEFSCWFFFGYCCCLIHLLAVFALNKWVGLCCCVEQSVHIKSSEEETKKKKKRRAN